MKPGWNFLNSKQIKELKRRLKEQYGFSDELDYAFLKNEKSKVFIVNRDIDRIDFDKLRINSTGMYFCEDKGSELRLSIEGSQIVGLHASKNIVELDEKDARNWLKGSDMELKGGSKGFVIIKSKKNFLGCAKHKNSELYNYVPKERRIRASD